MNKLVCYFSASGVTKRVAENISNYLNADLFEIEPTKPYTEDDLNWMDTQSRSSIEMKDKKIRPEIKNQISNIDNYNTIIIGYPIWWYTYPRIINTFIEQNNIMDKNVYLFATSGGSTIDKSISDLEKEYPYLNIIGGKLINSDISKEEIINWIK